MTDTGKQTALFFSFLTAAMTTVSAQAAPAPLRATTVPAIERTAPQPSVATPRTGGTQRQAGDTATSRVR